LARVYRRVLRLLGGGTALLAALLFFACATPYFERAAMEPGWSGGGGAGIGGGSFWSAREGINYMYFGNHVALKATLFGRYNFSRRFGLFTQWTTGAAYEISDRAARGWITWGLLDAIVETADIELGAKFGLGENDALRVALGTAFIAVPALANLTWLHDLDESWTTNLGLGTRGLVAGVGFHFPLGTSTVGHLSLTGAASGRTQGGEFGTKFYVPVTGQFGFAVEARPRPTGK